MLEMTPRHCLSAEECPDGVCWLRWHAGPLAACEDAPSARWLLGQELERSHALVLQAYNAHVTVSHFPTICTTYQACKMDVRAQHVLMLKARRNSNIAETLPKPQPVSEQTFGCEVQPCK